MATISEQLEAMRSLGENWGGYHAAAPCAPAINLAREFVRLIEAARWGADALRVHVGPTPPGGVLIDWEDNETEHEIDIAPDGSVEFLHRNKATKRIETRKLSPRKRVVEAFEYKFGNGVIFRFGLRSLGPRSTGGLTLTRHRVLLGTLFVLLSVFLFLVVLSLPWPGVNQSNFERVANGMTLSEVESLLGGPGEIGWHSASHIFEDDGPDPSTRIWRRDRTTVAPQGTVKRAWGGSRKGVQG